MLLLSPYAFSHTSGMTDTSILIKPNTIDVVYTLPYEILRQMEAAYPQESGSVGTLFELSNDHHTCTLASQHNQSLQDIHSIQYRLLFLCLAPPGKLDIHYSFPYAILPEHKNFVQISITGSSATLVFTSKKSHITLNTGSVFSTTKLQKPKTEEWGEKLHSGWLAQYHFIVMGAEHILTGWDHVLFIIALILIPMSMKHILWLISSFTVAHSITLMASALDIVSLSPNIVEPLIALSILYVVAENLTRIQKLSTAGHVNALLIQSPLFHCVQTSQEPSLQISSGTPKRKVLLTFSFGLIHGFGFSYVLKSLQVGQVQTATFLFFNIGVEVGQLLIIGLLFPALQRIYRSAYLNLFSTIVSICIGMCGAVWFVGRLVSL